MLGPPRCCLWKGISVGLFMGLWMYRIRKGRIGEATVIGVLAVLAAVIVGNWIPGSPLEKLFSLSKNGTILALTSYGFVASVLPVWLLLCPRDYLSSFLKVGTIALIATGMPSHLTEPSAASATPIPSCRTFQRGAA